MKHSTHLFTALAAFTAVTVGLARADKMASISIDPLSGVVALTPRWAIGSNLAGFHQMAQDLSLGGGANNFYSIKSTTIPAGGDTSAFDFYIAGSGAATSHADIGSKLKPSSYSALTSADPDIGFGPVNFYMIHHKSSGDYFTVIVPGSGTASSVTDLKPMDGPGGPATLGSGGYFGLTFAAANLGYGLDLFYYLRTDAGTGSTLFGTLVPSLLGTSSDQFALGAGGYNALTFTGTDVGFGVNRMYYDRLDSVTGFTILGTLNPLTGRVSDIANLGSVYSTLDFVAGDVGFGTNRFYTTGSINTTGQTVSFAAVADRAVSAGPFMVSPSASSGLAVTLAVVPGSTGSATISGPVGGVFTVTPTAAGLITLQATQAGQSGPTAFEYNMLRQGFTATGTSRIANFSGRALSGQGSDVMIMGFVVSGTGMNLLVRGIGPTLAEFGITDLLADATLALYDSSGTMEASNQSWGTDSGGHDQATLVETTAAQVGAFSLPVGSLDSSLLVTLNSGANTAMLRSASAAGIGLEEIYVVNDNGSRLINASARTNVTLGEGLLIFGFVIEGDAPKTVLIRGVGPALSPFGVTGVLADPQMSVFSGGTQIAVNNGWGSGPLPAVTIAHAAAQVGAFPLPAGSKDCSLLLTLPPGDYTVQVSGVGDTTGVALVEVYDADTL